MNYQTISTILYFYGTFLITCGIVSVIFIGLKAKTALISGGTSGLISLLIGFLVSKSLQSAQIAGIVLPVALFIVFSWRSTKTLFRIFELIKSTEDELKGKGIAFLIISLMAVVSMFVFVLQLIYY